MIMRKFILFAAALLGAAALGYGQQLPVLPNDPETRVGKLDNGLTYYIRHNDHPAERAEFYLTTNVGAIQEEPDQDGLAHFLEHMCFNGTKNFPDKGILNYLESIGASFGGNVNASTGVEMTVYLLNNIPLVRPTVIDTCILIMHDYSHFVSNDSEEIDKERGVILEEKRSRNSAAWRLHEKSLPYLYGDTKYAGCTIIGSEENLKTFKPESLKAFYETWYRPDMQALIVVGDVDVDYVEQRIKTTFADIPAAENPKQKDIITIPTNEEPIVGVLTDPECSGYSFSVYWKRDAFPEEYNNTSAALSTSLVENIASIILNERLSDLSSSSDAPFLNAAFSASGNICETTDAAYMSVVCKEGSALQGLTAALTEVEKARRYGFSDGEIERAKAEILSSYESAAKKADTRKNSEFVMPMIYNFVDNKSFMDPKTEYELVQAILPQIPGELVSQLLSQYITPQNIVALYSSAEREGVSVPSESEITAVIKGVENAEIEQSVGEDIPTSFLDASLLKSGKIKKSESGLYGSEVLYLNNGLKVVLYPTDIEKDKVVFDIYEKGGLSLISDEDLYSFETNIWALYLQNSGIAEFPSTTVSKMLSGKQLSVNPYIGEASNGVSGSSTSKDLETAMQLAHLYFSSPRFDEDEYNQGITMINNILPTLESNPNFIFNKKYSQTVFGSCRTADVVLSSEVVSKASRETLERNYKALFNGVNGATLFVAGDFDSEEVKPLICKYFGSLPKGSKKPGNWNEEKVSKVSEGHIEEDFAVKMQTPMTTVARLYNTYAPYDIQTEVNYDALSYVLDMVYVATLREDEGGTYGASTSTDVSTAPRPAHSLSVSFQTNNESTDKLRELATKGLREIAENGPTAEQFDKTYKNIQKTIPERQLRISYWLNALKFNSLNGIDRVTAYKAAADALSPEGIKSAAAELLSSGNFIEVVMRPSEE